MSFSNLERPERLIQGNLKLKNLKVLHMSIVRRLNIMEICSTCKNIRDLKILDLSVCADITNNKYAENTQIVDAFAAFRTTYDK